MGIFKMAIKIVVKIANMIIAVDIMAIMKTLMDSMSIL